jgi:hypothetical protein
MIRQPRFDRALLQLLSSAALLAGAAAQAQSSVTDWESGQSVSVQSSVQSSVSRAEVLADLRVYQESGLAATERAAAETGQETRALQAARQRYAALRQGERYATLVAEYAARRGEARPPAAKA